MRTAAVEDSATGGVSTSLPELCEVSDVLLVNDDRAVTVSDMTTDGKVYPAPFLKWAGGKRQLMEQIHAALPANFDLSAQRYFEPFIGGGAVAWSLARHPAAVNMSSATQAPVVINDVNSRLTATYEAVRDDVENLIDRLVEEEKDTSKSRYLEIRAWDVDSLSALEKATWMIYLNKTGFNGMYRENSTGGFNIPWGNREGVKVCDPERLRACSEFLKNVEIRNGSYRDAVDGAVAGDVVYLDPPYIPLSNTASFASYSKAGFGESAQRDLAKLIQELRAADIRVVFSNSDTQLTRDIFANRKTLSLRAVSAGRSIAASGKSRSRVYEVLGISFPEAHTAAPSVYNALPKNPLGH